MRLQRRAIVLVWVGTFGGSVEANIVGSNVSSSTSITASDTVRTFCSAANPTYSSLSCIGHNTPFAGSVSASPSKISGSASLGSFSNYGDYGYEIKIAASFSEMLTVNGGTPGTSGYLALPVNALLGVGDTTLVAVTLGSQFLNGGNSGGSLFSPNLVAYYTGFLISQFQYGVPFGFTTQASSFGYEGDNSSGDAGFSVSLFAPIVLSSIPTAYGLGFNSAGAIGFFDQTLPLVDELRPAGPNGAADVIAPEPNTIILTAVLVCLASACGGGFRLCSVRGYRGKLTHRRG